MDFNRADNYILQKNYDWARIPRYRLAFRRDRKWTQGCGRKASLFLPFSLCLSFFHIERKHDVHLISHLDNRAVVSRTNDVLRGIWRRIGRNGNELFNIAYWCGHLIIMRYIFIIMCFQKVKCRTRELLLMYLANWNSYLAYTDKNIDDAVIIDALCMSYRISLQLCICIEKINKHELMVELMSRFCSRKFVTLSIGVIWNYRDKMHVHPNVKCKINLIFTSLNKKISINRINLPRA